MTAPLYPRYYYSPQFSAGGQLTSASYTGYNTASGTVNNNVLLGIDKQDNRYYFKTEPGQVTGLATAGVWLTQNTDPGAAHTLTLAKYSSSGTLLWKTYIPNNGGTAITVRFDETHNIYVIGEVDEEVAGIGSPGVYQEHYISYPSTTTNVTNGYIVKLNPAGQKIWGTYSVAGVNSTEYYNGSLYTLNHYNPNMPGVQTTPGTFQPSTPALQLLIRWDAATGQRIWSTFYGTPASLTGYVGLMGYDIAANENGVFISGQSDDDSNTYYATPGAFKGQVTGGGDLFLSKFDFNGNRVWSTYFGSAGYDEIKGSPNMTLLGNRIVIAGNQYGNASNIATPGAFRTTPGNPTGSSTSMFFAEFDTNGNRKWCSYFGGPGNNWFGEQINPEFLSDGSLVLWGFTGAQTGVTTEGAQYPQMLNPSPPAPFGFLTKFDFRDKMATQETAAAHDLVLYDNPNNGDFGISGSVLQKENCTLAVYDMAGRILAAQTLNKMKVQQLKMSQLLVPGNYLVNVSSQDGTMLKVFKMTVKK